MDGTMATTGTPELADSRTARAIWMYCSPILIIIGTFNNILVLSVMLQKRLRGTVTCVYLSVLAVVDLMCLYTGLLRHWITNTFFLDIRGLTDGSCKVHPMLVYFALQFEAWILVNLTIERFTAVWFPLKAKLIFTTKKAAIGLAVTGILTFSINTHYLFGEYYDEESKNCLTYPQHLHFQAKIWPWFDLLILCFMPFGLMISMNMAVIWKIYQSKRISKSKHTTGSTGHFKISRVNQLTITLLVVSIAFFVTTLPLNVHLIKANLSYDAQDDLLNNARDNLIFAALSIVSYVNNVVNFFLYCFSGRRFRSELRNLFHCNENSVEPSSASTLPTQTRSNRKGEQEKSPN